MVHVFSCSYPEYGLGWFAPLLSVICLSIGRSMDGFQIGPQIKVIVLFIELTNSQRKCIVFCI